ncbi:hypothetical protein HMPREF1624_05608 [Sporothrix schenckii ATCC 58251]|uniref:DUF1308 domain-containing protein n=1 Tax=Sporothrix schenckii (strain ATCC 58251 / de Perez 2211183) TaxID=1391915 RepID=U7PRA0_SPOS1|nr:hypothetical protein HMPREF1624_05608 [Sporothrix schenckii ATCC 58251]
MFGQVDLGQHDGPGGCAPTRTSTAAALPDDSPAGLVARWAVLIAEYEAFQEALRVGVQQLHWPGVRQYISMLHAEARQTKRLAAGAFEDEPEKRRGEMRLAVTTLAAKEGMWRVIKTCRGVMALDRRFPKPLPSLTVAAAAAAGPPQEGTPERTKWVLASQQRRRRMYDVSADSGSRTEGMFVNAVVDNGRSWMRVLTTTNAQLLVEMAENGWEWGLAEGEDDGEQGDDALADISDMSLVILALGLIEAAHANCVRGAYPHIYILLTRMDETAEDDGTASQEEAEKKKQECAEIARYLGKVRRGLTARAARLPPDIDGCRLQIEIHSARDLRTTAQPPSDLQVALQRLLPDLSNRLTPTLNIDTSILITLTSDITNSSVEVRDWHPWQRVDEITREAKRPGGVLRSLMEDALCGRRLVCTREAAQAFRVMVYDMAQPSEQERARVLLGEGDKSGVDRQTLVNRYRELSAYPDAIPDDLMLPVVVETRPWGLDTIMSVSGLQSRDATPTLAQPPCPSPALPAVASTIANEMNDTHPTLSVFFYGWAMCYTTITTNLAARNRITRLLERHRTSSAEKDPLIWVCRTARSLNATNPRDGRKEVSLECGQRGARLWKGNGITRVNKQTDKLEGTVDRSSLRPATDGNLRE